MSNSTQVNCDVDGLIANITQIGLKAKRGVLNVMREEAIFMAVLAKEYAPIDEGNLEEAIKTDEDRARGADGRFGRAEIKVYIDPTVSAQKEGKNGIIPSSAGKTVGDYAWIMHEMLLPYGNGPFTLGLLSEAKDGGRGIVGGKFLERAVADRLPELYARVQQIVERTLR